MIKFGFVMPEAFKQHEFINNNDESAIIIADLGSVQYVQPEVGVFNIEYTHHQRMLILKNDGTKYSNIVLSFYCRDNENCEYVTNLEAASYNLYGNLVESKEIKKSDIYEIRSGPSTKQIRFAIPDVKAGTIIEFKYTTRSPFIFTIPKWYFQKEIPVLYSEYVVKMVPSYEFKYLAKGIDKFDTLSVVKGAEKKKFGNIVMMNAGNVGSGYEYNDLIYTFGLKNIPAYHGKAFSKTKSEQLLHIDFQLNKKFNKNYDNKEYFNSWNEIIKFLQNGELGKRMNAGKNQIKPLLDEMEIQNIPKSEKAKYIIEYVRKNFIWDGTYSYLPSVSVKELINRKTGNSADLNFLLYSLLQAFEINVYPVLISTRSHGRIEESAPFINSLNNIVLLFEEDNVQNLTDATTSHCAYNRIPSECLNEVGLKIDGKSYEWVTLESFALSEEKIHIVYNLEESAKENNMKYTLVATEYLSEFYRTLWKKGDPDIKEFFEKTGIYNLNNIRKNMKASGKQYGLNFDAFTPLLANNQKIVIYPFMDQLPLLRFLSDDTRKQPLDFVFRRKYSQVVQARLPDGFEVKNLPERLVLADDLIRLEIFYNITEKKLNCTYSLEFNKSSYLTDEYNELSRHVELISQHLLKPVILLKNLN